MLKQIIHFEHFIYSLFPSVSMFFFYYSQVLSPSGSHFIYLQFVNLTIPTTFIFIHPSMMRNKIHIHISRHRSFRSHFTFHFPLMCQLHTSSRFYIHYYYSMRAIMSLVRPNIKFFLRQNLIFPINCRRIRRKWKGCFRNIFPISG